MQSYLSLNTEHLQSKQTPVAAWLFYALTEEGKCNILYTLDYAKYEHYSKTCLKWPPKIDKTKILMTNGNLMKVKNIAECSPWSILQYFWPALSDI